MDTSLVENPFVQKIFSQISPKLTFLVSAQLQHSLLAIKILFIIFSFLCLIVIIYLLKKTGYHHLAYLEAADILKDFQGKEASATLKKWQKIKKNLEKESPVYWKLAILESEKMFDDILIKMGLGPGSMDDRLSRLNEDDLPNLSQIKQFRALCRDIAHDPDYQLGKEQAEEALQTIQTALTHMEVL